MFTKKTINDYDLNGKTVLLRADYNVPLDGDKILSNYRISQSLPTIRALQEKNCKIIICSHLGRPKSAEDKKYSLKPVAKELSKLLDQPVVFASDCIGEEVQSASSSLDPAGILLLENLRFHPGEKQNDEGFADQIIQSTHAEVLVQDGFGVVHRAHASTDAIARKIPAVAGLLLEREVDTITEAINNPKKPLMAIIGGAKISDKIDLIESFIQKADIVAIGGAMANTFLKAQDVEVGQSLVDENEMDTAHDILNKAREESKKRKFIFYLPQDGVVSKKMESKTTTRIVDWDAQVIADIESYPKEPKKSASKVESDEQILDIGPFSGAFISGAMQLSETVVWNGTMGVSEIKAIHGPVGPFAHGTELIIDALVGRYGSRPYSLIGGGDTTGYLEHRGMTDMFSHVSTGGGASLELMSGKDLPGVSVLWDK